MYNIQHRPKYFNPNSECSYKNTNEMIPYTVKGVKRYKPCHSIRCEKHSWIKRDVYGDKIFEVTEQYEYSWFFTLPIGPMCTANELKKPWDKFRGAIRRLFKPEKFEYFFMKELQSNWFHLHGTICSDIKKDTSGLLYIWCDYLKECLEIEADESRLYDEETRNPIGQAKYLVKAMSDTKGIQVIYGSEHRKMVYSSRAFSLKTNNQKNNG